MIRQIVLADQPILRKKLRPVKTFDDGLSSLVADMIDTMTFANGAGLAANQIGVDAQIFVTGIGPKPQVFINPKLKIIFSRRDLLEEGCLSVPGYRGPVHRPTTVEITYDNLKGVRRKQIVRGYLARVLQHEYDHLQGKLYIDHIKEKKQIEAVEPIRVAFFGSGEFAVPILVSLLGLLNWTFDFLTVGVVTQPARPAGRKQELTPTPIYRVAEKFGVKVLTPEKLDQKFMTEFKKWKVDLIVLSDYHKLLPAELLQLPRYGGVNVHPSLLPKYRWSAPIQNAILNGDRQTGVTLMQMNEKLDQGGIIAQYKLPIDSRDTYVTLSGKLSQVGAQMIRDNLYYYASGKIKVAPQKESEVTTAPMLGSNAGEIKATDTPAQIVRKVRALNPNPGVYTNWNGKRVKILAAHLEGRKLALDQLQIEGGKPLSWKDFKNGYPEFKLP